MSLFHLDLDFDKKLIDLIKANPMLYEKELRSTPYTDMKKKFDVWNSIATSLNKDTKYCILRWKSLRGKYRREVAKLGKESAWDLFEQMKFIDKHIKYQGTQRNLKSPEHQSVSLNTFNTPTTTTTMEEEQAEQLIEEIHDYDDDPLQEAMDEQISTFVPYANKASYSPTTTTTIIEKSSTSPASATSQYNGTMKRIEALLEGLGDQNRNKAEKRIVAFLCKCQLKTLSNEDVEDLDI